jgi:hypothetical protein
VVWRSYIPAKPAFFYILTKGTIALLLHTHQTCLFRHTHKGAIVLLLHTRQTCLFLHSHKGAIALIPYTHQTCLFLHSHKGAIALLLHTHQTCLFLHSHKGHDRASPTYPPNLPFSTYSQRARSCFSDIPAKPAFFYILTKGAIGHPNNHK